MFYRRAPRYAFPRAFAGCVISWEGAVRGGQHVCEKLRPTPPVGNGNRSPILPGNSEKTPDAIGKESALGETILGSKNFNCVFFSEDSPVVSRHVDNVQVWRDNSSGDCRQGEDQKADFCELAHIPYSLAGLLLVTMLSVFTTCAGPIATWVCHVPG